MPQIKEDVPETYKAANKPALVYKFCYESYDQLDQNHSKSENHPIAQGETGDVQHLCHPFRSNP